MPIPTTFSDLSTTAASNSPAGSDNVFPDNDNYLRAFAAFLASIYSNSGNGWTSPYWALTTTTPSVSATSITWSGNPTHSGNHIYSGNLTVQGNTTLGNAGTDTVTTNGNVTVNAPTSGTALTVASATAAAAASFASASATSVLQCNLLLGATPKAYLGLVGTAEQLIASSVQNDFCFRSEGGNMLFSTNSGASVALRIAAAGNVTIAAPSSGYALNLPTKTPASASDTGTAGDISWDTSYIYVCTAANTWKRAALSTW